jgi:hypothetical protein
LQQDNEDESPGLSGPETVVGYHGCHWEVAERVLNGEPLLPSLNAYDWLGAGIYFWEYAPTRAREWAIRRFGERAAVLQADITLGRCLNLLDTAHFSHLQRTYEKTVLRLAAEGIELPRNRNKQHFLDRAVVEFYCQDYAALGGRPFQSVRGCFPEGEPIFPGSKIFRETHVQVAVRDTGCISALKMVHYPE